MLFASKCADFVAFEWTFTELGLIYQGLGKDENFQMPSASFQSCQQQRGFICTGLFSKVNSCPKPDPGRALEV